jgi:hypothetical protein
MEQKIISRIEELSRIVGDLIDKREHTINSLRKIDSEIDTLSLVMLELKNLIESESP